MLCSGCAAEQTISLVFLTRELLRKSDPHFTYKLYFITGSVLSLSTLHSSPFLCSSPFICSSLFTLFLAPAQY